MKFKNKLKELRLRNNLTQASLADIIFVSRSTIAKWEAGLGLPNEDSLDDLCNFFDVTREELLVNNYYKKQDLSQSIHNYIL